jgi:hypothetical protein
LIKEVVNGLERGIDKFESKELPQGDPTFILLARKEGWAVTGDTVHLS